MEVPVFKMVLGLLYMWFEMQMYLSNFLPTGFAEQLCEPVIQYLIIIILAVNAQQNWFIYPVV